MNLKWLLSGCLTRTVFTHAHTHTHMHAYMQRYIHSHRHREWEREKHLNYPKYFMDVHILYQTCLTHTHTPTHTQLQSDTHRACIRLFSGNWSLQTHPLPSTTYKKRLTYINTFTCQRSVSAVKPNHMNSTFCEWGQRMALYGKPLSYDHGKRSRETIDTHTHTHITDRLWWLPGLLF